MRSHIQKTIDEVTSFMEEKKRELIIAEETVALLKKLFPSEEEKPVSTVSDSPKKRKRKKNTVNRGKSKYKGVTKRGRKWSAQFYENKKLEHLGTFDSEELAAAAYAERAGNKNEAQRLREIALNGGNNTEQKTKKRSLIKAWQCRHCKLTFKDKPVSCPGCRSASFDEVTETEF